MKVILNRCYGGFGFSEKFTKHIKTFPEYKEIHSWDIGINRNDQFLIQEAIKFGLDKANGEYAKLVIEEIPDEVRYSIGEYDGQEWISQLWIEVTLQELKNGLTQEQLDILENNKGVDIKIK
jgi:hypothetical protein